MSQPTIRSKPFIQSLSHDITSPFFDENRNLHFICQNSGEIMMINELEKVERVHLTHGQPNGALFDAKDGILYITDFAHGAVLSVSSQDGNVVPVVNKRLLLEFMKINH
jgi:sugar lactone lactonase YvrE